MLNTVDQVIEALGGTAKAADLTGVGAPAVSNWRSRGKIPQENFLIVSAALDAAGKSADSGVFGFKTVEANA